MSTPIRRLQSHTTNRASPASFRRPTVVDRRHTVRRRTTCLAILSLLVSLIAGCTAGVEQAAGVPTAVLPAEEIRQLQENATEVADSYWGSWPDSDVHERVADDVVFWDPADGDFTMEGKAAIAPMLRNWVAYFAAAEPSVEGIMLSADAAAYRYAAPSVMWPPWSAEPPDHPPVVFWDVIGLEDTTITRYEVWFEDDSLEMLEYGCFATDGCPKAQEIIDRYLSAWSSRDRDQIAALYADDAVFTDSLFGIDALGSDAISSLADMRFGSDEDTTLEVLAVYAQTNGHHVSTEELPEQGDVIGIALHHRVLARDTADVILESITAFELGDRHSDSFEPHPDGLIAREEVFHDPAMLVS